MISLTYLSSAIRSFTVHELADLLDTSRSNNLAAELTGLMLYADGHFIQTLEGPQEEVDRTFARIARDRRHRQILVALREETTTRNFPDWSMGFELVSQADAARLPGFSDYLEKGVMSPENARAYGKPGIFHRIFRDTIR